MLNLCLRGFGVLVLMKRLQSRHSLLICLGRDPKARVISKLEMLCLLSLRMRLPNLLERL